MIYTERFLQAVSTAAWTYYTVPEGRRAIVMSVAAVNASGASEGSFYVMTAGVYIVVRSIPAQASLLVTEPRVAVYGGETIGAYCALEGIQVTVSGYLFEDDPRARAPRTELGPPPGAKPS